MDGFSRLYDSALDDCPSESSQSWSARTLQTPPVSWRGLDVHRPLEFRDHNDDVGTSGHGSDPNDDKDDAVADAITDSTTAVKSSRYLREMDRHVILERLQRGEKQATLAKEFNVSRAAICNLFKHRHEVLARVGENPFAKHPKKKKKKASRPIRHDARAPVQKTDATPVARPPSVSTLSTLSGASSTLSTVSNESLASQRSGTLHVVRSKALQLLLTAMGDSTKSLAEFRRHSERAFWLLIEEALALVPVKRTHHSSSLHPLPITTTPTDSSSLFPSIVVASPPCGISMEHQDIGATPMLDIFQLLEPRQPIGSATVLAGDNNELIVDLSVRQGSHLRGHNVFVLNVVAASSEAVRATIERLVRDHAADEASVLVVSLFASSEVVTTVQCKYPRTQIVTARIDSTITRRRVASTPVDIILERIQQAYANSQ